MSNVCGVNKVTCSSESYSGSNRPSNKYSFNLVYFDKCESSSNGGVIAPSTYVPSITFTSCTFSQCHTSNDEGGAIYYRSSASSSVNVEKCIFSGCYCNMAGGAIASHVATEVTFSTFTGCHCSACGGAIYSSPSSSLSFTCSSCTFKECYTSCGGAIDAESNCILYCTLCNFINCYAEGSGGAIYTYGSSSSLILFFILLLNHLCDQ